MSVYEGFSDADLLEAWRECLLSLAGTRVKAGAAKRPSDRQRMWAAVREIEGRENLMRAEIYSRMGCPADFKRPGLAYYAASKNRKTCERCGSTGGMNGKSLHWLIEGEPLAWRTVMKGGSSEDVKQVVQDSECVCTRCAKKAGVTFTAAGKPSVKLT